LHVLGCRLRNDLGRVRLLRRCAGGLESVTALRAKRGAIIIFRSAL
jgi:hypothetical protein